MSAPASTDHSNRPCILAILSVGLLLATMMLAYKGWSFYRLSLEDRPEHPAYRTLRASGNIGNGYGWVAALLVLMNLSYLIRRKFGRANLGAMRVWLDTHVFTGLLACILASFHSTFILRTPIASMTTASLLVVVITGLLGRFLHMLAPANQASRLTQATTKLDTFGIDLSTSISQALDQLPAPFLAANSTLLTSLRAIPIWQRCIAQRRRAIAAILGVATLHPALSRASTGRSGNLAHAVVISNLGPATKQQLIAERAFLVALTEFDSAMTAETRRSGVTALLRTWRGLHRFFALLMVAAVLLHAGIAWHYGYRWIFE
jgi:hypothetical protein